ncbi:uncharacterized protein PAC_19996 [Phialocephala subalpina]|uniref:CFEM domain-containing protein n=1 Tax=Phialocephala subalpina TaxID=576137 RepID=A0A1L7XYS1_9HELO|nr:uncharacterized protein PAC_19996 [Phialocephala subalpina]
MLFLWNFSLLVVLFCSNVLGAFVTTSSKTFSTTITSSKITSSSVASSSSTKISSSSVQIILSAKSSSPSPSFSPSTVSSIKSTTTLVTYNLYALTTTFTQLPACTSGYTAIEDWGTDIYDNLIFSSVGYNLTYTSCFPPQFYNSVLASIASTTLPAFTALICPATWENYEINSIYIICCPSGYGLIALNYDNSTRPGAGAVCTSYIGGADGNGTIVWANAFDGFTTTAASVVSTSSISSSISTTTSSHTSTSSSSTTSKTSLIKSTSTTPINIFSTEPTSSVSKTSSSSTSKSSSPTLTSTTTIIVVSKTSSVTTTTSTAVPSESNLPACGVTCFNILAQYSTLGCNALDSYCLCSNVNFGYGIRDCSNGACGTAVASTVIAFGSAYCSSATATHVAATTTIATAVAGESNLPACGITCFDNMLAQYSSLGCNQLDSYCLCSNVNFGYGLRDCSNGACGTAVASTVIAFGSAYCSTASATHIATSTAA